MRFRLSDLPAMWRLLSWSTKVIVVIWASLVTLYVFASLVVRWIVGHLHKPGAIDDTILAVIMMLSIAALVASISDFQHNRQA